VASAEVALFRNDFLMGFRYFRLWSVVIFCFKGRVFLFIFQTTPGICPLFLLFKLSNWKF
jgi:hypothetical protein